MEKEGLKYNTINKHYSNVQFFVEEFLDYYYEADAIEGIDYVDEFLGDWFIRKAMWSTEATIKSNITSFKKFYKYMMVEGHLHKDDYNEFLKLIKEDKSEWINRVNAYNQPDSFANPFDFDFDFDYDPDLDSDDNPYDESFTDNLKMFMEQVKVFSEMKPWRNLYSSESFVLVIEELELNLFLTVLGNGGETYGLVIYDTTEGFLTHLDMINGNMSHGLEQQLRMNAFTIYLSKRRELNNEDLKLIKNSGVQFNDDNMLPQVIRFVPHYEPEGMDQTEFEHLVPYMADVMTFIMFMKDYPEFSNYDKDRIFVRRLSKTGEITDKIEDLYILLNNSLKNEDCGETISELEIKRITKKCVKSDTIWEIDKTIFPMGVNSESGNYYPSSMLVVDMKSGQVIDSILTMPSEEVKGFQKGLVKIMTDRNTIPEAIKIINPQLKLLLQNICDALKIEIILSDELDVLMEVKYNLFETMAMDQ
jgi:hypothetical protein